MAASIRDSGQDGSFDKAGVAAVTLSATPNLGNILIIAITIDSQAVDVSSITNGMEIVEVATDYGTDARMWLYKKIAAGTESATFTITLDTGGTGGQVWVAEYLPDGADTFNDSDRSGGSGTAMAGPAAGSADTVLNIAAFAQEADGATYSAPSEGFAIGAQLNPDFGGGSICILHHLTGSNGGTPDVTSDETDGWACIHASFNAPASSGIEILRLRADGSY